MAFLDFDLLINTTLTAVAFQDASFYDLIDSFTTIYV